MASSSKRRRNDQRRESQDDLQSEREVEANVVPLRIMEVMQAIRTHTRTADALRTEISTLRRSLDASRAEVDKMTHLLFPDVDRPAERLSMVGHEGPELNQTQLDTVEHWRKLFGLMNTIQARFQDECGAGDKARGELEATVFQTLEPRLPSVDDAVATKIGEILHQARDAENKSKSRLKYVQTEEDRERAMREERQRGAFQRLRNAEVGVANVEVDLRRHTSAYSRELNGWQMLKANDEISDSTATFLGHYFRDHVDIVRDLNNAEDALSSAAGAARRARAVRWYARQESNFSEVLEDDIRKFENWQAERHHYPAITSRSQYDGKEYCWIETDRVLSWLRGWTEDDFDCLDTAQRAFRMGTNLNRPFDQKQARPMETFREVAADIIGDNLVDALKENLIDGLIESVVTDVPEQANIEPRTHREKLKRKADVFPSLKPIVVGEEFSGMIDRKTRRKIDKSRRQGLLQWETMKEAGLVTELPGPPSPSEYLASEGGQGKSRPTATRKRPRHKVPQNILNGIVPSAIVHSARQRSAKQGAGQQNETTMQRAHRSR